MTVISDLFTRIKENISIANVLTAYGIKNGRMSGNKTFALCPFHNEKSPSLAIYTDTNSFNCFGCGASGSVIDFVGKLYNLTPLESAKKLNDDFHLGLDAGKPPDKEQIQAANEDRLLLESLKRWINDAYITLCDYLHLLQGFKENYRPKKPNVIDIRYIEAIHNLDYIEYLTDTLMHADFGEQVQFFKTYRKEVDNFATRVTAHRRSGNNQTA